MNKESRGRIITPCTVSQTLTFRRMVGSSLFNPSFLVYTNNFSPPDSTWSFGVEGTVRLRRPTHVLVFDRDETRKGQGDALLGDPGRRRQGWNVTGPFFLSPLEPKQGRDLEDLGRRRRTGTTRHCQKSGGER